MLSCVAPFTPVTYKRFPLPCTLSCCVCFFFCLIKNTKIRPPFFIWTSRICNKKVWCKAPIYEFHDLLLSIAGWSIVVFEPHNLNTLESSFMKCIIFYRVELLNRFSLLRCLMSIVSLCTWILYEIFEFQWNNKFLMKLLQTRFINCISSFRFLLTCLNK